MKLDILLEQADQYKLMEAGDYEPSQAYDFGELVGKELKWFPDFDLRDFFVQRGGTIHYIDYAIFRRYPDIFTNSIYVRSINDFDIILPAYASMTENRFTLAHELGHYILHAKRSGKSYARRNGDTPVEKQADCFAMGFLIPSGMFRSVIKKYETELELSLAFRVPVFVIQARLRSLDIKLK